MSRPRQESTSKGLSHPEDAALLLRRLPGSGRMAASVGNAKPRTSLLAPPSSPRSSPSSSTCCGAKPRKTTFNRDRRNLWLVGGEIIRRRHDDPDLKRLPVDQVDPTVDRRGRRATHLAAHLRGRTERHRCHLQKALSIPQPVNRGGSTGIHPRIPLTNLFVFDGRRNLLLQKRAISKYHSAGLWSNTCCGHPRPGETTAAAARRRLREEMGFDCNLVDIFSFIYRAELENGIVEHEYDHVFLGEYDGSPSVNPIEVAEWKLVSVSSLISDVNARPDDYTYWLKAILRSSRRPWAGG